MYFKKVQENNLTYSIDMLRLKCEISENDFKKLEPIIQSQKILEKRWEAFSITDFRYNYNLSSGNINDIFRFDRRRWNSDKHLEQMIYEYEIAVKI